MPAYDYPLLIKQLLVTPLAQHTPKEIVYRDLFRFGYAEFRERIGRAGSALSRLGVRHGDTVAIMDWCSHRYLECYFAIPTLGAALQTVNVRLTAEQIQYCLNHAGASVLICNLDFLPIFEAIRGQLPAVRKIVWISETGVVPEELTGEGEYESLLSRGDPKHEFPDFDENTRATIFYTTGTTGLPKGVTFSHQLLVLHTLALLAARQISRDDVYTPTTPMFHVHAWGFPYAATLAGCTQVYPGRYIPEMLCGSAMPRALCEAALERGINVFTGYGMSETCPVLTIVQQHPEGPTGEDEQIETRMKAGLPVPLVDLRVVDADMNELAHDGVAQGEVVARAPWLTQSYHKNEGATEALWAGGYLHTQDVGSIDPQGYLQITDRIKDVIKTGGEWLSSIEIESIISQHPGVREVAVIAVPDAKWGERPAAIVVPHANAALEAEDVVEHVLRRAEVNAVSKYAVPERVFIVDALPKTSVGKLDKKLLRQTFAPVVLEKGAV